MKPVMDRYSECFTFRLTPRQRQFLEEKAKTVGLSVTVYIRYLLQDEAGIEKQDFLDRVECLKNYNTAIARLDGDIKRAEAAIEERKRHLALLKRYAKAG